MYSPFLGIAKGAGVALAFAIGGVAFSPLPVLAASTSPLSSLSQLAQAWTRQNPFSIPRVVSMPVNAAYAVVEGGRFCAPRDYGCHNGVDFAVPIGTPVIAMFTGVVRSIISGGLCGDGLEIVNGSYLQRFCHAQPLPNIQVGQVVQAGQQVATVNMSGRTSGPHLHAELWVDGKPVDIEAFFKNPQQLNRMIAATTQNSDLAQSSGSGDVALEKTPGSEHEAWKYLARSREWQLELVNEQLRKIGSVSGGYTLPDSSVFQQQLALGKQHSDETERTLAGARGTLQNYDHQLRASTRVQPRLSYQ